MIKILSSADWHVNLHRKKIPNAWQMKRFQMLFEKLHALENECDVHVIAGDLFDKEPEPDEVCLVLSFLNAVRIPTLVIPGNHEATSRGKTFWEHFKLENTITNPLVTISIENERICMNNQWFCTFPYGSVQTDNLPTHIPGDVLVTHIRGEVPPHISAEYDFEKIRPWNLVLLGDLHFRHRYKDYNVYYPGSPLNTTFDRDDKREYGVDVISLHDDGRYDVRFVDLGLPKLVRRTVTAGSQMVPDSYHHVVYEVTGSIDQLAKVERSELLDKKLVEKENSNSTLDLKDKSLIQELEIYLKYIKASDVDTLLNEFKSFGIQ